MKKLFSVFFVVVVSLVGINAFAQTEADIQKHPSCKYCGMDRGKFNYSRMVTTYSDGSEFGACSIHCAAIDLVQSLDKAPTSFQVGDYNTKKLIDAEKASWVIGGKKPGVMTKNAKWAFEKEPDALAFIKENEGKLANFEDAMKTSYEDMYADTKMIRAKRAKMKEMQKQQEKKP
jgi:copper chaperone NosL